MWRSGKRIDGWAFSAQKKSEVKKVVADYIDMRSCRRRKPLRLCALAPARLDAVVQVVFQRVDEGAYFDFFFALQLDVRHRNEMRRRTHRLWSRTRSPCPVLQGFFQASTTDALLGINAFFWWQDRWSFLSSLSRQVADLVLDTAVDAGHQPERRPGTGWQLDPEACFDTAGFRAGSEGIRIEAERLRAE
jgi:hypothetical protein